ncbi:MAG: S9 family peptidase [Bacteroidales bacterium]|nr:S9 family peptidase [Bacteroidales bacterium]
MMTIRLKAVVLFYSFAILPFYMMGMDIKNEKKNIDLDFFAKVKCISNLKEKNGNIFFILRQPDIENNNYSFGLYQLTDGKPVRLAENVSDYFFQDNGIIFRGIRKEKDREKIKEGEQLTVFQKLNLENQEVEEWLRLPARIEQVAWIDKEHFFYTSSDDQNFEKLLKVCNGNRQEALKKQKESKNCRIFDELPFWSNGKGDISDLRTHLYDYDQGEMKLLTDTLGSVSFFEISPDNKTLVYVSKEAYCGKVPDENHLIVLNTATLEKKEWPLFNKASYGDIQFLSNDEIVLTIDRSLEHDKIENAGFYRLNLRTGKLTEIYDGSIYGFGNKVATDIGGAGKLNITFDKDGIRYVTTNVDYAPLIHVSYKDGKVTFLTKKEVNILEYVPYKDGFLAIALVGQQGNEIYLIDKKGNATPLTSINKPLFDEYQVVEPVKVTFTNEEGVLLNGYVLPPAGYEKGKKYPAILDIHGGPKGAYGTVFFHEMQYWANHGYAVMFTNPTGSNGRGSKFSDIRGRVGGIDYRDLMTFVDTVLTKIDFVDGNRLGVLGGSYGGYMTNWIIGHTNRFKAAASLRCISSWISHSSTSDIGYSYTYDYLGTDIWKNSDLLWDRSPLKYADKVKTPTLFLHSDEDYRCYVAEGLQMYHALQQFNVPSRFVLFKGENHDLSRTGKPLNRIKRLAEITEWFDQYLKQ